jgi:DTW domain-containing protein YfiP
LESAYVVHPEAKRIENAQVSIAELRTVMVAEDAAWTQAEKVWVDGLYARNDLLPFLPARGA